MLWRDGTIRDLGARAGNPFSAARAINDAGQIVGWGGDFLNGPYTVLRWDRDGTLSDLGTFGDPRGVIGSGINDDGQVVAWGIPGVSRRPIGYFWSPTDGVENLTTATGIQAVVAIAGLNIIGDLAGGEAVLVKLRFHPTAP